MYRRLLALTIMDRYCICTGLLGMVSGPPDTSCILSWPPLVMADGSTYWSMGFRRSFPAQYCQSAQNLTSIGMMPAPTTLTVASLQCPSGPSPLYSSPMLNPPQ